MNKIKGYLLFGFPQSIFLDKLWWHRLGKVIYAFLVFETLTDGILGLMNLVFANPDNPLVFLALPLAILNMPVSLIFYQIQGPTVSLGASKAFGEVVYLIFAIIVLNLVYRTILYTVLGDKWKTK